MNDAERMMDAHGGLEQTPKQWHGIKGYPKAGKNSGSGVRVEIKRFATLPESIKQDTVLLYFLLGGGTMAYKMPMNTAAYTDRSKIDDQNCANCPFAYRRVVDGKVICSQVRGEIKLMGWCKLHPKNRREA